MPAELSEKGHGQAAGAGVSIRSCLRDQLTGYEAASTMKATHFTWKVTACPSTTKDELLAAHKARFGQLPRCNETALQPAPSPSDLIYTPFSEGSGHQRQPD